MLLYDSAGKITCNYFMKYCLGGAGVAQSVWRLAAGWMVRGSNPGGGGARFSAPVQTGPGAHPASCTMGTGSFLGVKRPGHSIDHPPPSSAKVKEGVELYVYSLSEPSWPVLGRTLLYYLDATHENMANVTNFGAVSCKFNTNRIYLHNKCLSKDACDGGGGGGDL
jgi:hypothetical protein